MSFRQRIRAHDSSFELVGRLVLALALLIATWYGAMLVALSLKFPPDSVNTISGYRTVYDFLAGLGPQDFGDRERLILGLSGLAAFVVFGYLAARQLPRPYLARDELVLREQPRGVDVMQPRAVERVAEGAALAHPAVTRAAARYLDGTVELDVELSRARELPGVLKEVHAAAADAVEQHGLPGVPLNVTFTAFKPHQGRELQ